MVLHVLRLVERAAVEFAPGEVLRVDAQQVVGGDQHVAAAPVAGKLAFACVSLARLGADAHALALGAHRSAHVQGRGEALELGHPVVHEGGGAHDEAWPDGARLALACQQKRDELHRLAQAHLVGQDAAEIAVGERAHPAQPFRLVGAQRGGQLVGHRARLAGRCPEAFQVAHERAVALCALELLVEVERVVGGKLHRACGQLFGREAEVLRKVVELGEVVLRQIEVRAALQTVEALAPPVARQQRRHLGRGQVVGGHGEVDEVARQRDAHRDVRLLVYEQPVERGRGERLAQRLELDKAAEHEVGHRRLVAQHDGRGSF